MVFAPRSVASVCTTVSLSGASSWAIVTVPSPQELKASCVPGSNALASTPQPMGTVATTLPLVLSIIKMMVMMDSTNGKVFATSRVRFAWPSNAHRRDRLARADFHDVQQRVDAVGQQQMLR